MSARYLLDTDTLTLFLRHHPQVIHQVLRHLPDEMAVPVITIEEILAGWYTALRKARGREKLVATYDRLTETVRKLRN